MVCEAVILAAGLGTRMVSETPKALHRLAGVPLLAWVERACREAAARPPLVVIGPEGAAASELLPPDVRFVVQVERRGTGHAVLQAEAELRGRCDLVLVATADMPLIRAESLRKLIDTQQAHPGPVTLMTLTATEARGFGRVARRGDGRVEGVIEEAVATPDQLAIGEFNASLYCFDAGWLWGHLPRLQAAPNGELYLTDLVAMAASEPGGVATTAAEDPDEVIGINTREHLARAEQALRRRVNRAWMLAGVTLADPETTYIEPSVRLAPEVEILPNTHLRGATAVGRGTRLGPNSIVNDSVIGEACTVESSVVDGARLDDEVHVGPFAHLRPGARLGRGVHMGNFGEVKNSHLGPGVKMGHFSYVGDAEIGGETNIGAGTITCNFGRDGKKNHTRVGQGVFIGSDSLLVAPVEIGDGAATGAGSVVTRDVPPGALAVGMPARVVRNLKE
jgi:bifunctional UDP-N-acetylglucosamine pyrophosphorylase/glucosamine-1-phosphate N-acetyltransferase